tara:strand:- start:738 stop:887 length:150 start_codon:yes stop_codon:yes gene_type:complete
VKLALRETKVIRVKLVLQVRPEPKATRATRVRKVTLVLKETLEPKEYKV